MAMVVTRTMFFSNRARYYIRRALCSDPCGLLVECNSLPVIVSSSHRIASVLQRFCTRQIYSLSHVFFQTACLALKRRETLLILAMSPLTEAVSFRRQVYCAARQLLYESTISHWLL